VVAVRFTGALEGDVDCPSCGLPLPPIVVEYDVRGDGPRTLTVSIVEPVLTAAWWAQVAATHPTCVPDRRP
jgi:hypothetical protein